MNDATLAPGRRLSQIRQELGLSQRRVAELSGLTHSAISTIEQDKVSPAVSTLQKLLKVYGLSLSEFFFRTQNQCHAAGDCAPGRVRGDRQPWRIADADR
jgi:HTH-type transcriptional repressor of puuD